MAAQHQYNNTVRGQHKPVIPAEMDGPWPEGAKQDLNQFERGGGGGGGVVSCILRRGAECLCLWRFPMRQHQRGPAKAADHLRAPARLRL